MSEYIEQRLRSGDLSPDDIEKLTRAYQLTKCLPADGKPGPITIASAQACLEYFTTTARGEHLPPQPYGLPNLSLAGKHWLSGIDVSHHQTITSTEHPSWADVQFAFVKATEGTSGSGSQDPKVNNNVRKLRRGGDGYHAYSRPVGLYHFARPSSVQSGEGDPMKEAENFARTWTDIRRSCGPMLPPVLDIEDTRRGVPEPPQLIDWCGTWCGRVCALTGRTPIIYTYLNYLQTRLSEAAASLNEYHLWIAKYSSAKFDLAPETPDWPWLFWQWTGSGRQEGVVGDCDHNFFRGTEEQLRLLVA